VIRLVLCYLGLGSNVDDRPGMIARAAVCLASRGDIVIRRLSRFYLTRPWGDADQEDFLNAAVEIETHLSPLDLLEAAKAVERGLGREPGRRWGPRRIDIDILLYGEEVVERDELRIPHPRLCERAFALAPLAEIAPDLVHPETGVKIAAYLAEIEKGGEKWQTSPTI
jgi:2-amino-4-hydroxy-6-hydroxymethyldihydropteridine diphosphokinase